jgi:hypothetical protein
MAGTVRISAAAALVAALAAGGVTSLGHAGTAVASNADRAAGHLEFYGHAVTQTPIDVAPAGESQGDQLIEHGLLYDHKGGRGIGRFTATCTTLTKAAGLPADWDCSLDAVLPGGQLYTRGYGLTAALFSGKKFAFGVVGGTGRYRGARGDGTIAVPNETDGSYVLDLLG